MLESTRSPPPHTKKNSYLSFLSVVSQLPIKSGVPLEFQSYTSSLRVLSSSQLHRSRVKILNKKVGFHVLLSCDKLKPLGTSAMSIHKMIFLSQNIKLVTFRMPNSAKGGFRHSRRIRFFSIA